MLVLICGKDLSNFLFLFVNLSLRKKLPFKQKSEHLLMTKNDRGELRKWLLKTKKTVLLRCYMTLQ